VSSLDRPARPAPQPIAATKSAATRDAQRTRLTIRRVCLTQTVLKTEAAAPQAKAAAAVRLRDAGSRGRCTSACYGFQPHRWLTTTPLWRYVSSRPPIDPPSDDCPCQANAAAAPGDRAAPAMPRVMGGRSRRSSSSRPRRRWLPSGR
jgi:hypothetical protein